MNRLTILTLALVSLSATANAQCFLDAPAQQLLEAANAAALPASRSGEAVISIPTRTATLIDGKISLLVTFSDPSCADALVEQGYEVFGRRGDMALVVTDFDGLRNLSTMAGIKSLAAGHELRDHLSEARATTGVEDIQKGVGLDKAYDGTGVVCGIMDSGLDPNHINFTDADGKSRISRLWVITGNTSSVQTFDTPEKIAAYTTDRSSSTHGTHVLGIIGGSYTGKAKVAKYNDRTGRPQLSNSADMPYYGVAPGADLVPCAGTLEGNNICLAADKILEYANSVGAPAVLNLSLGTNVGPHDGTTSSNRYLAEVGKDMIICISAGNEGDTPISYNKTFSASDKSVKTCVGTAGDVNGVFDIWSSDNKAFKLTFAAVNKNTGEVVYSYEIPQQGTTSLTGDYYTNPAYVRDPLFTKYFTSQGYVIFTAGVSADNNRHNYYMSFGTRRGENADIVPALFVEGDAGQSVLMTVSGGTAIRSNNLSGYVNGNDEMSISDMACGDNVISVGAYTNLLRYNSFDGERSIAGEEKGAIASFSSYGKRFDGTQLPLIAGPGLGMLSSYSYYYVSNGYDADGGKYMSASVDHGNRSSYWKQMSGTSMSSPFVAGVCALWLQADPTLTVDEVKTIMKETADQDEFTKAAPHRFGYGKINALAGLKRILGLGSVTGVKTDSEILVNTLADGTFDIFAPGASTLKAELFGLSGALAASTSASGESLTLAKDAAAPGVYVLRVTTDSGATATRKVIVK